MEKSLPNLYSLFSSDKVLNIAHRGASAYFPENTMAAFEGAIAMQADMIELDVQLSKDGVPVVFHDRKLKKHSSGRGRVSDHTFSELKRLDAGSWFSQKFSNQRILHLQEVIDFAAGKICLNIEIKSESVTESEKGGVEQKVLSLVEEYDMKQQVLFSSFDYRAVERLKKMDEAVWTGLLFNIRKSRRELPSKLVDRHLADSFHCSYSELNGRRLQDLQYHDIPFLVYTVDRSRLMRRLKTMGAKGIFTNKPDLLKKNQNE